jgi:RHS repeat-associated protein
MQDASGSYYTYHYDMRASTVALTKANGVVTDRYTYGPFGELLSKKGNTRNVFLYDGRDGVVTDRNGLYFMRARYYSTEMKRFVNEDTVLGGIVNGQ